MRIDSVSKYNNGSVGCIKNVLSSEIMPNRPTNRPTREPTNNQPTDQPADGQECS